MHCPHCHNPIELDESPRSGEVVCPSCGSTVRIETDATATWSARGPVRTIGRFELLGVLGSGAFGTVHRARDPQLDRVVALKVPRAGHLPDGPGLDRFLREARSAAQLHHPGIVPVHEVGEVDGTPYIVSEFVPGVTLADRLTAGRFAYREAAEIVARVAEALGEAHRAGVIHRDIKPSNIMVRPDGTPVLLDFGLARREAGETTVTVQGDILGTPAYMSPEQARGEGHRVDGRSDVYALGVVLYQLLCGVLPFQGNSRMLLHQVLHDDPRPPRRLDDGIPRDLETISLKAMAKEPSRRYGTAVELAAELRRTLNGQPILARPVGRLARAALWCRRHRALAGAMGGVALALLLAAGLSVTIALLQYQAARREGALNSKLGEALKSTTAERDRARRLNGRLALERAVVAHHEHRPYEALPWLGRALEFGTADDALHERSVRAALAAMRVDDPERNLVRFGSYKKTGGPLVTPVLEGAEAESRCSPDGSKLLVVSLKDMGGAGQNFAQLVNLSDGEILGAPMEHDGVILAAAFSPRGDVVATGSFDGAVKLWDAADGRRLGVTITPGGFVRSLAFSPDGTTLVAGGGRSATRWRVADGSPLGPPLPHTGVVSALAFSPDGSTLLTGTFNETVAPKGSGRVRLWDAADGSPRCEPVPENEVRGVAFSPDGSRFLTLGGEVSVRDTKTGKRVNAIFHEEASRTRAAFLPDGLTVAVVWTRPGERGRWRAGLWPAEGSDEILGVPVAYVDDDRVRSARYFEAVLVPATGRVVLCNDTGFLLARAPYLVTGDRRRLGAWIEVMSMRRIRDDVDRKMLTPEELAASRQELDRLGGPPPLP